MSKKAITFIACQQTYQQLVAFHSIEELNESVYAHLSKHKATLSKTTVEILKLIGRYSVKYLGVSFLTKQRIGESIGKSRRTVIRICHELEELGIIKQYATKRNSDQQQTSNAIVIQKFIKEEEMLVETANVTQDKPQNVTPKNHSSLSNPKDQDHTYWSPIRSAYEKFQEMCHCFTNEQRTVSRLYGIYLAQIKCIKNVYHAGTLLQIAVQAIKISFQATKKKTIQNIFGYYNGVLNELLDQLYYQDMKENFWSLGHVED
ncbi:helix-turn-helix domain-containing protein [Metabacillus herbersteinensis]|uniref:Helix-turn-helix domain-containing protein n=1 Tax=Metabacillus herbersteinensis TaxID=283816 RepID=A0ABV6GG17_9BACI